MKEERSVIKLILSLITIVQSLFLKKYIQCTIYIIVMKVINRMKIYNVQIIRIKDN